MKAILLLFLITLIAHAQTVPVWPLKTVIERGPKTGTNTLYVAGSESIVRVESWPASKQETYYARREGGWMVLYRRVGTNTIRMVFNGAQPIILGEPERYFIVRIGG